MNITNWNLRIFVLILGFGLSSHGLAAQLAAKKDGVKIRKAAKRSAPEIATLKKGETVEMLSRSGMFWEVKTQDGKKGFVSFTKVKRQAGTSNSLAKAIRDAAKDSRDMDDVKSTRSRSAVMGVRGLDESDETAFAGSVRPNLRMVYAMEDRVISAKKLDRLSNLVQKEIESKMR